MSQQEQTRAPVKTYLKHPQALSFWSCYWLGQPLIALMSCVLNFWDRWCVQGFSWLSHSQPGPKKGQGHSGRDDCAATDTEIPHGAGPNEQAGEVPWRASSITILTSVQGCTKSFSRKRRHFYRILHDCFRLHWCLDLWNLRPHLQMVRSISVGQAPTIPDTDGVNEMLAEAGQDFNQRHFEYENIVSL